MAELGGRAGATGVGPGCSLHGTGIQQLSGKAVGVASPQGQLARLRPGELIAATDAMVEAFNKLVHKAEHLLRAQILPRARMNPFKALQTGF